MIDFDKENFIDYLVEMFLSGCKREASFLGLECEHFIVDAESEKAIDYFGEDNRPGVEKILKLLADRYSVTSDNMVFSENHIVGFNASDFSITIEPAAQMEISVFPQTCVDSVMKIYREFKNELTDIVSAFGYGVVNLGYQPVSSVHELNLIPKERYRKMDEYFSHTGKYGINMMRGTAAVHVSIDYVDESDFVLKFRTASLLTPFLSYLCSNIPVFEGNRNEERLKRLMIWREVDNDRCGIVPGTFDANFGFRKYAEYIVGVPLIFMPVESRNDDLHGKKSLANHMLSMVFNDVRLKSYIEIRCADSMGEEAVCVYLKLISEIFYGENLAAIYRELINYINKLGISCETFVENSIRSINLLGGKSPYFTCVLKIMRFLGLPV